jgi:hypothetical protein
MHVSAIVGDLAAQCSTTQEAAHRAIEQAEASGSGLATDMAEVADGFRAILSRLESLELNSAPLPARPTSLLHQLSAQPSPSAVDGGVDSSFATQLASLQSTLAAQQDLLQAQQLELAQQREQIGAL